MSRSENGSLSSPTTTSSTTTPTDNNSTISHQRLCHIVKRDNFDGYGFNLHSEKGKPGQYIGKVDEDSPAEEAGLRQGDRIIEVNGVNIGSETHKQVVQRIKAIANEVRLLVIDPNQEIKNVVNNSKTANDTVITSPIITTTSTITVQSSTVQAETTNQTKSNKEILDTSFNENDSNNRIISGSASPTTSVKNEMNSAASCSSGSNITNNNNNNNNNINKSTDKRDSFNNKNSDVDDKNIPLSPPSPSPPPPSPPPPSSSAASSLPSHQNGTTTSMALTGGTGNSNQQKPTGLNLPMTAAEMRAKLLSKKKYDPKNDSVDLRKKFEIIQKL